jgi:hypothetical protein
MGQEDRNIKQIRTKWKEWIVGKGRVPGRNCTGKLIIVENA